MYEVGEWFVYLMNFAILAILGLIVLIALFRKRGQYQKVARQCIQAEIWQPTGWPEFYTVKCALGATTVNINEKTYKLNPDQRRWGLHPRLPFLGLASLQVPIRKEYWYVENDAPITSPGKESKGLISSEIKALQRAGRATQAARHSQQLEAANNQVINVLANQARKEYLYLGLGIVVLGIIVLVVRSFVIGG